MGLNREMLINLKEQSFHKLCEKDRKKWDHIVGKACANAGSWLGQGDILRRGDIAVAAEEPVRIDSEFRAHCVMRGITDFKQWAAWFAEYLVEQVYPEPGVRVETHRKG